MNGKFHPKAVEQSVSFKKNKADLLETLSKIDKVKEFLDHGVNSLFRYCTEILGLSESDTYQLTQVVRKSVQVPKLKEAVRQGTLSVEKASRIASVIHKRTQDEWIAKAAKSTHREIEKAVREAQPMKLRVERILPKTFDRSELRLNISDSFERKLKRAQEVFRTTSIEETLEHVLEVALKAKDPSEKAKRAEKRKQLRTCEVRIPPPKSISRYIPAALKHQVQLRDEGMCQHPGCRSKMFTDTHHILEISKGGKHALDNLITLCGMHHNQEHRFRFGLFKAVKNHQRTLF